MLKRLPGLLWTVGLIAVLVRKFAPDLPAKVAERVSTTAAELPGAISVEEPTAPGGYARRSDGSSPCERMT